MRYSSTCQHFVFASISMHKEIIWDYTLQHMLLCRRPSVRWMRLKRRQRDGSSLEQHGWWSGRVRARERLAKRHVRCFSFFLFTRVRRRRRTATGHTSPDLSVPTSPAHTHTFLLVVLLSRRPARFRSSTLRTPFYSPHAAWWSN